MPAKCSKIVQRNTVVKSSVCAMDESNIFEFTGAEYASWAMKIQFGLLQERLISTVMDFKGKPRVICPAPITPLAQGVFANLPATDRGNARDGKYCSS